MSFPFSGDLLMKSAKEGSQFAAGQIVSAVERHSPSKETPKIISSIEKAAANPDKIGSAVGQSVGQSIEKAMGGLATRLESTVEKSIDRGTSKICDTIKSTSNANFPTPLVGSFTDLFQ